MLDSDPAARRCFAAAISGFTMRNDVAEWYGLDPDSGGVGLVPTSRDVCPRRRRRLVALRGRRRHSPTARSACTPSSSRSMGSKNQVLVVKGEQHQPSQAGKRYQLLAGFGWFVYFSFAREGRWLSFVIPAGTLVANYAAITSFRMIFEEREKRKIRKSFAQYLSPGVIGLIEKDPQKYIHPGGETKDLTVMFSDIRGFTTISEGLSAEELVRLLNEYLGVMTDVLFANLGTLDKYIGDAIMAFWGSPYPQTDHAYRGCLCALQMSKGLAKLNAKWKQKDGRRSPSESA